MEERKGIKVNKKALMYALIALVAAAIFWKVSGGGNLLSNEYKELERYLANNGYGMVRVKSVEINRTNTTDSALAGGIVTVTDVTVNVKSAKSEDDKIVITDFTIEENDTILLLRPHSAVVLPAEGGSREGQKAYIKINYLDFSETLEYGVVYQRIDSDNKLLLANKYSYLPESYEPAALTRSELVNYRYGMSGSVSRMEEEATNALSEMLLAAKADGYTIWALSGYRGYGMQRGLYNSAMAKNPNQTGTAAPGTSEHQTGFAMDLVWAASGYSLSQSMQYHDEYEWLTSNSYKYGFILRYPKGCADLTGYKFEPWHYRYIGKEAAEAYAASGCSTFDEFASYYYVSE